MKGIFLEYSLLPQFGSFSGGNGRSIPIFWSLSGREWNGQKETLIPPFSLKSSNFCSPHNWEECERKIPLEYQPFFFSFSCKKYSNHSCTLLPILCKVKLLLLVFLFLCMLQIFVTVHNKYIFLFLFLFLFLYLPVIYSLKRVIAMGLSSLQVCLSSLINDSCGVHRQNNFIKITCFLVIHDFQVL